MKSEDILFCRDKTCLIKKYGWLRTNMVLNSKHSF